MEKPILVPTDFSDNAWAALLYAADLASEIKTSLKIVHAFNQSESAANNQMNALLTKFETEFTDIAHTSNCIKGNLSDTLKQLSVDEPYKLIVMGTKGATGLKSIMLGSNTLNVINQSLIPVLAVPQDFNYNIQKVGLLSNYKNFEIDVMKKAIEVLPSSFTLTLLHVREDKNTDEEIILDAWKEVMKDNTNLQNVECKLGIGSGVPSVVNAMIKEEEIDLLIATNNNKSFFRTLFNRNLIKAIAIRPQLPVLFVKA